MPERRNALFRPTVAPIGTAHNYAAAGCCWTGRLTIAYTHGTRNSVSTVETTIPPIIARASGIMASPPGAK